MISMQTMSWDVIIMSFNIQDLPYRIHKKTQHTQQLPILGYDFLVLNFKYIYQNRHIF